MMATVLGEFSTTALVESVAGARHRVTSIAASYLGASHPVLGDIEHLASEVLTNAVVHTKTALVDVTVTLEDQRLRVAVRDDGSGGVIALPVDADPLSEHGRGLFLLTMLAAAWDTSSDEHGSVVWFEVRI